MGRAVGQPPSPAHWRDGRSACDRGLKRSTIPGVAISSRSSRRTLTTPGRTATRPAICPKGVGRPLEAAPSGSLLLGHRHVSLRSHTLFECLPIDRGQWRRSRVFDGTDRGFDTCDLVGFLLARCNPWFLEHDHLARVAPGQRADDHEDTEDPNRRPIHQMILPRLVLSPVRTGGPLADSASPLVASEGS